MGRTSPTGGETNRETDTEPTMEKPLEFAIAIRDFDLHLLPEDNREPGTERFGLAVGAHFEAQFAPMLGRTLVIVDADQIRVSWVPEGAAVDPKGFALSLLREGRPGEAVPLLEMLLSARPDDAEVLYNLGMAESDLGDLAPAVRHLSRAVEHDPTNVNALVALALAQLRDGREDEAERNLRQAVAREPENGDAHRNLGALLGNQGRLRDALPHFREAARLLPEDPKAVLGLAQGLAQSEDEEDIREADQLHRRVIGLDSDGPLGEMARTARREYAERRFRGVPGLRMDAVMYCLAALERFADMTGPQVQAIVFEAALLGQKGFSVNDPSSRYTLRSLPGTFSGLGIVCLMYTGFQRIKLGTDVGFDLSREYAAAQQLLPSVRPSQ